MTKARTHSIKTRRLNNPPEAQPHQTAECGICGRPIEITAATHWVECINGSLNAVHIDDRQTIDHGDPGYLGLIPMGSSCARKIPASFKFLNAEEEPAKPIKRRRGRPRKNRGHTVRISTSTRELLQELAEPGESVGDVIERVAEIMQGLGA